MAALSANYRFQPPRRGPSRLFASLFFLIFLGMGSAFAWLVLRDTLVGLQGWTWQPASCEVLSSGVSETPVSGRRIGDFAVQVSYRYDFAGLSYTAENYQRKPKVFSDYGKATRLAQRFQPGTRATCYVNPAVPSEAVLARDNLFSVLLVGFPLIFVAIGAGGLYFTWRSTTGNLQAIAPISNRAGGIKGARALRLFFAVFFLMGSAFLYLLFLRPGFLILTARNWPAVPCEVLASEVESHRGNHGSTYNVNILYRYQVNGQEFKANRYDFVGGSSSGYSGKQAIVSRYSPGTRAVCYVNPSEPTEAVLERGFTATMWFGLIPLVFVVIGAGGLVVSFKQGLAAGAGNPASAALRSNPSVVPAWPESEANSDCLLKPKASPWVKVLGATFAALFWNGIVSVFLSQAIRGWRHGGVEIFLTLFLVPFVLVGLGLLGATFYFVLALFNPRPRLRISPGAVALGGTLRVAWELGGRIEVIQRLRLRLEGREEATYRRGTNTAKDTNAFFSLELADLTLAQEMRSGSRDVSIPAGLMHSFSSTNNKIVWVVRVHGDIPRWPDINEEFTLTVLPQRRSAASPI